EITRDQWRRTMASEAPAEWAADKADDAWPANSVSWLQAVAFCNRLSSSLGLEEAYEISASDVVRLIPERSGYRLPTEAEWEYACRAGTATPWFFGWSDDRLGEFAWEQSVHDVATRLANPWGFHDLTGNVLEWCHDRFDQPYDEKALTDPRGPDGGARLSNRVLRGGSFDVV
ncbi:MAG: SUMF1/EgtB/PvdO family nonheme iron enzyme, partial [Candidatus Eisenbacteria bacterium]|nr:SUMF1/EgtB/PvdO family nonheme iron enzyme [Candidatus Eisenbacteria bacterium]